MIVNVKHTHVLYNGHNIICLKISVMKFENCPKSKVAIEWEILQVLNPFETFQTGL